MMPTMQPVTSSVLQNQEDLMSAVLESVMHPLPEDILCGVSSLELSLTTATEGKATELTLCR
jgi:hypothetical protein